jgi:hypothetical protein
MGGGNDWQRGKFKVIYFLYFSLDRFIVLLSLTNNYGILSYY